MARGRRRRDDSDDYNYDEAPAKGAVSIYADGLPERMDGEHADDFEARLKARLASIDREIDHHTSNLRATILTAFIRHLNSGQPATTFCYRNPEGLPICDHKTIERWKRDNVPEFFLVKSQIEIALSQCEARWVEHLGKMATGQVPGNIRAMEMYMKRFFSWDVDLTGQEEGRAIADMFRSLSASFNKPKEIDI